jgi:hypothetical protein
MILQFLRKSQTIKVIVLVIVLVVVIVGVETSFHYKNVYVIISKGMASLRLMRMNAKTLVRNAIIVSTIECFQCFTNFSYIIYRYMT